MFKSPLRAEESDAIESGRIAENRAIGAAA
jgi:hypothetical protein